MIEFKKEEPGRRLRVTFICTDQGQHKPLELGHSWIGAIVHSHHRTRNAPVRSPWGHAVKMDHGQRKLVQYVTTWGDPMRPDGTEFCCPKCARNPQKRQDWMESFMAGIRAAGITEVDISRYLD